MRWNKLKLSWERERRKLWEMKNVYDYISQADVFNPFIGKVVFREKLSCKQFRAVLC